MNNKYRIMLVEDEQNIQTFVTALLEANGYQVVLAGTCAEAEMIFNSHNPDLVILDLGLPDRDGQYLLRGLREKDPVPVVVLSARDSEEDKVEALDAGANDYVTKPFSSAELLARVRAALRNSHPNREGKLPSGKFVLGDLSIDYEARRVFLKDVEINLTQVEYNIISYMSEYVGKRHNK